MSAHAKSVPASIPVQAGIGLRFPHHRLVAETKPDAAWFEVHPENYMAGGAPLRFLETIRRDYPISLHGVGLSLGSTDPLDREHLSRFKSLIDRIEPGQISDHLSWSSIGGVYLADLLPLPYTEEALDVVARNIEAAQDALGRTLLIENPSTYLAFNHSPIREEEFIAELVRRTGCGILCDINNLYVAACNHGIDAHGYLRALPPGFIGEIHLAGHVVAWLSNSREIRIDDHGSIVDPAVWQLYERALALFGPVPTLIEWDTNLPAFNVLQGQARHAQHYLDAVFLTDTNHARVA